MVKNRIYNYKFTKLMAIIYQQSQTLRGHLVDQSLAGWNRSQPLLLYPLQ